MNQQQATKEKEKHYLRLEKPLEFKGTINGDITTTVELAKQINKLFKQAFGDYEGCTIGFNQFGQPTATLFFKEKGGGDIIPLASPTRGANPNDRIKSMNLRYKNKTYKLSDELKDVLEQFVDSARGQINWDQKVHEITENGFGGVAAIYVKIDDINVNKILKVMYGGRSEEGRLDYNVTMIKPVGAMHGGFSQTYIIKIDQLDVSKVEKLATQLGVIPSIGTIPMIRE